MDEAVVSMASLKASVLEAIPTSQVGIPRAVTGLRP